MDIIKKQTFVAISIALLVGTILGAGLFYTIDNQKKGNDTVSPNVSSPGFEENNSQNQQNNQIQDNLDADITDGVFEKFDNEFLFLETVQRGTDIKKFKLSKETKYVKIILINKGDKTNTALEEKERTNITKEDFEKGDHVSVMHESKDGGEINVIRLRKMVIQQ